MIKKRNICVVSSSRADYNHLFLLMKALKASKEINFKLLVTGMHLLEEFGNTYKEIIEDGFHIDAFIRNKPRKDTNNTSLDIMSDQLKNIGNKLDTIKPDIVVILGDRYDILQIAISCHVKNIPIAHFHGGELTHGAIDDAIRHSITKFSDIHFVADKVFKKRVEQLGENPRNIYNIGSLGVLAIKATKKISKSDILKKYDIQGKYILIALHPETINSDTKSVIESLFKVLSKQKNLYIVFSAPNSDPGNNMILRRINNFIKLFPQTSLLIVSAGREDFINLIRYAELIIGNSSSCIIEAPALGTTSLIIGKRQNGRPFATTVNRSGISYNAISNSVKKLLAGNNKTIIDKELAYKSSNSLLKIVKILSSKSLDGIKLKKFIDY
jgi:UDP-hydrolysing UDP-N-acetyl-D-glucosamine 2-epimerase